MSLNQLPALSALSGPVLITGHSGFKGTWLTLLLEKLGIEVVGFSLSPEKDSLFDRAGRTRAIKEVFADICDYERLNSYINSVKPSAIIHMAAQPLVLESYRLPRDTFEVNVMGTVNVLDSAFNTDSVQAVVVVTTDKVYRNVEKLAGYTEDEPLGGKDPYSASKAATEMVVSAWQNLGVLQNPKFQIVAVRAGNVIGGGDTAENRLIPDLVRGFHANAKTTIRFPNSIRPWQHVLDPLNGYLTVGTFLMSNKKISPAYNFGPGEESKLNVQQMAELACEQWPGSQGIQVKEEPNALPESGLLWLSSNLANQELGWRNRFEAKEAIRWTIEWERESMNSTPVQELDNQILAFFGANK
jgi:CDP-glucose 4,6-dehydratase